MYPDHLPMEGYEGIKLTWHAIFGRGAALILDGGATIAKIPRLARAPGLVAPNT